MYGFFYYKGFEVKKKEEQHTTLRKEQLIEALEKTLGIVTQACKICKIERSTHYAWLKEDPEYKKKVDGLSGVALDFAESSLMKQIRSGAPNSTIFYLKCKGKKRGYIERQEVDFGGTEFKVKTPEPVEDEC